MESRIGIDQLLKDYARSNRAKTIVEAGKALACPEPHELAAFAFGLWDEVKSKAMRAHVLVCSSCARRTEEIRVHPSDVLLGCHVGGLIPAGAGGDVLRIRISAHLGVCGECQRKVQNLRSGILEWGKGRRDEAHMDEIRKLLQGVAMAAIALSQRRRAARVAPSSADRGVRRAGDGDVTALVFDSDGRLLVEPDGTPRTATFSIERAEIDSERGIMIKLSTADPDLRGGSGNRATLEIALQQGDQILRFDTVDIMPRSSQAFAPSGLAILRAEIPPGLPSVEIPAEALRLRATILDVGAL